MSFATIIVLAHIVARALALVGGRAFAHVATKGTIQNEHLRCFLRRLHAKGVIGAEGQSILHVMKMLVHAVAMVARFEGLCPVAKVDRSARSRAANDLLTPFPGVPVVSHDSS